MREEALAKQGHYHGEEAVWLYSGDYECAILPRVGGNLIAFRDREREYRFLHEPEMDEMEVFKARPIIHGIPVLFPPNRYEDGRFPWNGRIYTLPVNEKHTGNHLHGFLYNIPWEVESHGNKGAEASYVRLKLSFDSSREMYRYFPHTFIFWLEYTLSEKGLQQQVYIRNDGNEPMPCLLAFHTSLNAPFCKTSRPENYLFQITLGQRWELNERMLPTGKHQMLTEQEEAMKGEGAYPFFESMDNHYTAQSQNGRNRAVLTDLREQVSLVYDAGASYKQWMIWNNNAKPGFFCPEPQVNLVNAPNIKLPPEEIGLFALAPGELWQETSLLYCIPAKPHE
ncbi:aldose 1-epimerase [Paenibacillus elgii]|uniref:aldose 1-epimerase n=1 Tax=Paenibacillus elgii TaxID=189691 RepID=UPI002D7AD49D|nr:aldose 1-epimerase [Paenibacillus elgii]